MGILERSSKQKIFLNTILLTLLAGLILFIGLLIWRASQVSRINAESINKDIGFGWFKLMNIDKQAVSSGHRISMKLQPSLGVYFLICLFIGSSIGLYRSHRNRRSSDQVLNN